MKIEFLNKVYVIRLLRNKLLC